MHEWKGLERLWSGRTLRISALGSASYKAQYQCSEKGTRATVFCNVVHFEPHDRSPLLPSF
jgi:hypothetical protein